MSNPDLIMSADELTAAREKLYSRCIPEPNTGCWLWEGMVSSKGYGSTRFRGKALKAHRLSYQLHYQENPGHLFVRHKCDQPSCINPEHLILGTHQDNMADMIMRGRNPRRRLSSMDVAHVRAYAAANPHLRHEEIGKIFNIAKGHASDIIAQRKRVLQMNRPVDGKPTPAAWVVLLNYGKGAWSGEMLTDHLPSDDPSQYKVVRPLYASPAEAEASEGDRKPIAWMLVAPGCEVGPVETQEGIALSRVTQYPPGSEVRPLYASPVSKRVERLEAALKESRQWLQIVADEYEKSSGEPQHIADTIARIDQALQGGRLMTTLDRRKELDLAISRMVASMAGGPAAFAKARDELLDLALSSLPAQAVDVTVPQRWRDVGYLMACIDDAIEQGYDPDVDGPLLDEIRAELKAAPSQPAAVGVTDEMVDRAARALSVWKIKPGMAGYRMAARDMLEAALRSTP